MYLTIEDFELGSTEEAEISAALVERIIKGDKLAETHMVERYQEGLKCVLRLKVNAGEPHVIDDVVQDTWQLVIEKVRTNQLKDPHKLAAFIINIGKNQLIMHYRKDQNKTFVSNDDQPLYANPVAEPEQQLERLKNSTLVRSLIAKLKKPRDREILTRFYFDEDTRDSIGEAHGLDELHINRVMFRARQRFKALWQKETGNTEQHSNQDKKTK